MASPAPSPDTPADRASTAASAGTIGTGAALTLAGTAVGGVLLLLNEWLAARWLGLPGYGLFALALALAKIGDKLAVLGLHVASLRFIAPARQRGDQAALAGLLRATVLPCAAAGVLLAGAGAWLAEPLAMQLFDKPALAALIGPAMLAVPFFALCELLGNIARGYGRLQHYVIARHLAPQLSLLLLLLAGRALAGSPPGPWPAPLLAAWAFALSGLVAALIAALLLRQAMRQDRSGPPAARETGPATAPAAADPHWRRRLWAYAVPVWANSLLYLAIGWADLLLLGWLAPAEAAGLYRACTQAVIAFDMLSIAFNAASANAFALAAAAVAAGAAAPGLAAPLAQALRGLVLLGTPLLAVLLLQADAVLLLLGPAFVPAADALRVLALGQFVHAWFSIVGFALVMSGRQGLETRNAALAAALNIGLNLWLIPRWGPLGAALASASTLLALNLLRLHQLRRHHGLLAVRSQELRLLAGGLALAAAGTGLVRSLLPGNSGPAAAILQLLTTAACAVAGLWFLGLRRDERVSLLRLLCPRLRLRPGMAQAERSSGPVHPNRP